MRTTLKRGIGRGAAVNGNGRSVLPPAPPPLARTIYRQPEPDGRGFLRAVGRILFLLLVAASMVALSIGGGYYLFLHESVSSLRPVSVDVKKAADALQVPQAHQPTVALVVGYDHRKGLEHALDSRSDTIMLLRADPRTNTISMLSFPRDLRVMNYCPGKPPWLERINAAYSICGARGTLSTVQHLTTVQINYLITVNFAGFKQIVDRLGGIWVDVDRRYYNKNVGTYATNYANINLLPGYQKLNGSNALDYVRFRHTDSDLYRLARQQQFVKAIKERITDSFIPTSIPRVIGGITHNHNVEVAEGGSKQLDFKTVLSYAFFAYNLPAGHLFQAKIDPNSLTGVNELEAPTSAINDALDAFLHPDVNAGTKAADAALGRKSHAATGPRPADVTISVLNGNGVLHSAANASTALQAKGYQIIPPPTNVLPNAPTFGYSHTEVYYDPLVPGGKAAARKVAQAFGDGEAVPIPAALKPRLNGALLLVVVGKTFQGTLAPTARDQTPKHAPPAVRTDPGATLPTLRPAQKRVPFKLEVPTVLEKASNLDTLTGEVPLRVYPIKKGHRAVRLTYLSGNDLAGYWGIEETDWDDAPVLQQPSETRTIKGRRYDLYFSSSHLHMVVLRENGATYWVVNTLLDALSNETMLAIARGLRPLGK